MTKKLWFVLLIIVGCQPGNQQNEIPILPPIDHHTYAKPEEAIITHLDLDITVDFEQQLLGGTATYQIKADSAAEYLILDANGLQIDSVVLESPNSHDFTTFTLGDPDVYLGASLKIDLGEQSPEKVKIYYRTTPGSAALQWLNPQQTYGKKLPFLFTQGQAVLTRSWIPIQDSPGIRFTYQASVRVPSELIALMSATNPQQKADDGLYLFQMDQAIPAYLMALAVGDLSFDSISDRCGIYAEPGMLEAAAFEMADIEKMVQTTEDLYGPYLWGRYDLIVLPPSFPFGGMENPRLTFATPTIIAGDRSLTSLVAHELAHSWSGNLVTNATWDDFWINEGHTVYLERRIMEKLYGKEYADMLALLGYQDLESTIKELGDSSVDTHLKLSLIDRDPDEGMNDIAYEKGALLLRTLEEKVGREHFDRFLKKYFQDFKFKSISTEQWERYITIHLIDSLRIKFDLQSWLYEAGLPKDHAIITSNKFQEVDARLREFVRIGRLDRSSTRSWTSHEWIHFVRHLPSDLHNSFYEKLDNVFAFSASGNSEILAAWLELSIRSKYMLDHNKNRLEEFLIHVGRRKFLLPLYKTLVENGEEELAKNIFARAKENYHSIAAKSIEEILNPSPIL